MEDSGCDDTLELTKNGGHTIRGVTPTNDATFIQRYLADEDYQNYIAGVWGERAYDTRPGVALDYKTREGIRAGWGYECTGDQNDTRSSRHNAFAHGVRCCSKFKNGQMAFNIDKKAQGEDCGYGWSGRRQRWDDNLLKSLLVHVPPAWMNPFLNLNTIPLPGCDIDLLSGAVFADLPVTDQLLHLEDINSRICKLVFGDNHPLYGTHAAGECGTCIARIRALSLALYAHPPPTQALCRDIVYRIFALFEQLHQAVRAFPAQRGARRLKKALRKFTRDFLRLCIALPQVPNENAAGGGQGGGAGGYKKRRRTRRKRRRRKRKTRRRRRRKNQRRTRRR